MKKNLIRALALTLTLLMLFVTFITAASSITFSDVPKEHWGYNTITKMTEAGLFKGTTEPIDGVGTFSPDKAMTRAEFIAVALRAVFTEEAKTIKNGENKWWDNYYFVALTKGLLKGDELDNGELDKPMTREEMAMVLVRCVEKMGESLDSRVEVTEIADYDDVGDYYKEYVRDCFSFGLICGIDTKGTFAPTKTLNRAEAATVLCRLIDKDSRIAVELPKADTPDDTEAPKDTEAPTPTTPEPEAPKYPWENGGKPTSKYTWAEYEALPDGMKNAFCESFETKEAFIEWFERVDPTPKPDKDNQSTTTPPASSTTPEKKPSEYTWAEYEALTDAEKEAFPLKFESQTAFAEWFSSVYPKTDNDLPWNKPGSKQPSEYNWSEYVALTDEQKTAFAESFENRADFVKWYNIAYLKPGSNLPWEQTGKPVTEYTWEEFLALPENLQDDFYEAFEEYGDEAFELWFLTNMPTGE